MNMEIQQNNHIKCLNSKTMINTTIRTIENTRNMQIIKNSQTIIRLKTIEKIKGCQMSLILNKPKHIDKNNLIMYQEINILKSLM